MNSGRKRFYFILLAAIVAGLAGAAVYARWFRHGLPHDVREALHGSSSWTLASLDPDFRPNSVEEIVEENLLHDYKVLGRLALSDPRAAIESVERIDRSYEPRSSSMCFRPRHAIEGRLLDGRKLDILICYECANMKWYVDGVAEGGLTFRASGAATLNDLLKAGGIPLPKQPE